MAALGIGGWSEVEMVLDANCHHLSSEHRDIPHFSTFTVGTHILFGW
jgi:hypothetical protein